LSSLFPELKQRQVAWGCYDWFRLCDRVGRFEHAALRLSQPVAGGQKKFDSFLRKLLLDI
jgi:hypothetical protein